MRFILGHSLAIPRSLIRYDLCEQIDNTYVTCSSKLPENIIIYTKKPSNFNLLDVINSQWHNGIYFGVACASCSCFSRIFGIDAYMVSFHRTIILLYVTSAMWLYLCIVNYIAAHCTDPLYIGRRR